MTSMNDEYDNVQWDTPSRDPFTQVYSENFMSTSHVFEDEVPDSPTHSIAVMDSAVDDAAQNSPTEWQGQNMKADKAVAAKLMSVRVENPEKRNGSYMTYLVTTTTFSSRNPRPVRRRFKDFVWLHDSLSLEYPTVVTPPLPDKHRMEYIKGDRFGTEFIERRRLGLQWFLSRIAQHPILQQSQCTRVFLESHDFKNDKRLHSKRIPQGATVLESLTGSIFRPFSKVKKPDERFLDMKDSVDKLEENLKTVGRLFSRIGKRQNDLGKHYADFAGSLRGLSALETNVDTQLRQFAKATDSYVCAMNTMANTDENLFLNWVHELQAYCNVVKDQLRERDQKQVEFEELTSTLQSVVQARERVLYPGRNLGDRGSGSYITDLMADKMNEARGSDMGSVRQDRIVRLEMKISQLQEQVAHANDAHVGYSSQMVEEIDTFERSKTSELKEGLAAYADSHIDFYEKGVAIWSSILPVLANIDVHEGTPTA